jgi:5-methylcytosine-specific restriction endonuclease McrA
MNWQELRQIVLSRDNNTCIGCGSKDNLEVHHLQEVIDGKSIDAYQDEKPENLLSLCEDCHHKIHSKSMLKKFDMRNRILTKLGGKTSKCPMHKKQVINGKLVCIRCGESS